MCMNRPIRAIDAEWTPPRRTSGRAAFAAALDWALLAAICLNIGMDIAFLRAWYLDKHPTAAAPAVETGSVLPAWDSGAAAAFPTNNDMDQSIIDTGFLRALSEVESGTNDAAFNPGENAHGRYQIRPCYLADANEYLGTAYTIDQMHDPATANTVVWAYLTRWGEAYERRTGRPATAEVLARIHNGGPRGAERSCTIGYASRFARAAR